MWNKRRVLSVLMTSILVLVMVGCDAELVRVELDFESNGGTVIERLDYEGSGTVLFLDHPTKDGYVFDGWYWDNETFEVPFTADSLQDTSTDMRTLYAKWVEQDVVVLEGESAYEIYLSQNPSYTGTEVEWMEDLVHGRLATNTPAFVVDEVITSSVGPSYEQFITINGDATDETALITTHTITASRELDIDNRDDYYDGERYYTYLYHAVVQGEVDEIYAGYRVFIYTSYPISVQPIQIGSDNNGAVIQPDGTFELFYDLYTNDILMTFTPYWIQVIGY